VKGRQIRKDVQAVLDRTVLRMKDEGFADYEITQLRSASLHSLRHTGATFDAPHRNPKHLQADLRHKSLATTQNIYYHALDDERSSEMAKLSIHR
jgi:integrase